MILSGNTEKSGIIGLQVATLMASVILLVLGLARMGAINKLLPDPVIVGISARSARRGRARSPAAS